MKKLFGTDGIRGVAGQSPLDPPTIHAVGLALAHHLGQSPRVLIGQDTRESSDWIAAALTAGLVAGGATVDSAGVIPTPAVAYLARAHKFSAGVVISASHNPWVDNGIKLFGPDGYKLPDATELAIEAEIFRRLASSTNNQQPTNNNLSVNETDRAEYIRSLLSAVPNLSLDGQRIVIDCANGAACAIAPQLFAELNGNGGGYGSPHSPQGNQAAFIQHPQEGWLSQMESATTFPVVAGQFSICRVGRPSCSPLIASAWQRRPGPAQSSSGLSLPRRSVIRLMPCVGSSALTRIALACPGSEQTKFKHQWMP